MLRVAAAHRARNGRGSMLIAARQLIGVSSKPYTSPHDKAGADRPAKQRTPRGSRDGDTTPGAAPPKLPAAPRARSAVVRDAPEEVDLTDKLLPRKARSFWRRVCLSFRK